MKIFNGKPEQMLFSDNTVIEHGMVVEAASLSGSCGLVVRGILKAGVDVDADVIVDSTGTVEGDINSSNCIVRGRVEGNISATATLHITSEGSVSGNIECSALQVDNGGKFTGSCNHSKQTIGQLNVYDIFAQKDVPNQEEIPRFEALEVK